MSQGIHSKDSRSSCPHMGYIPFNKPARRSLTNVRQFRGLFPPNLDYDNFSNASGMFRLKSLEAFRLHKKHLKYRNIYFSFFYLSQGTGRIVRGDGVMKMCSHCSVSWELVAAWLCLHLAVDRSRQLMMMIRSTLQTFRQQLSHRRLTVIGWQWMI